MEVDSNITSVPQHSLVKRLVRGRRLDLRGFWAIADQGVVSLGNFLTTIILARAVSPEVYGVWSVIFGLILFLNAFHASLITYPLSVCSASRDDGDMSELMVASLALSVLMVSPQALILIGASFLIGGPALALWAAVGLLFWQLQETTRRLLMVRLAFRTALFTDAISYLGQAGLLWLLARHSTLSAEVGFGVVAVTCAVAALVQARLLRLRLRVIRTINLREWARRFWQAGRWVLASNVASNFGMQAVPWALFLFRGPAEAAGFQAISNLLGVSHPIMLSLGNIVIPAAARAHLKDGLLAAKRITLLHAAQGGLLLLPYVMALLLFPRQFLGLFYGSSSPYVALDSALRLLTVLYALQYCSLTLKFLLNALEKNRPQFVAELSGSLVLAALVVPLVLWFGLPGAIVATAAWLATRLTGNALILRQLRSEP
jgi:O-antigen/teichoic acid export membrane protein